MLTCINPLLPGDSAIQCVYLLLLAAAGDAWRLQQQQQLQQPQQLQQTQHPITNNNNICPDTEQAKGQAVATSKGTSKGTS
jgi:hypothetical protein